MIPAIGEDGLLYPIEKMAAHRAGQFHLAVSVFIFDGPDLLIQRRALGKYHCGGAWANTCCSHPHWGEAPAPAATRRLQEELGFETPLRACSVFDYRADVGGGLWEHERVHVYRGDLDRTALRIAPNPDEVSETRWAAPEALRAEATAAPDRFAPWFRIYLREWDALGLEA